MPRPPAPGRLALVQEFVNTYDVESGTDDLDSPASLDAWLKARGLTGGSVSEGDLHAVRRVREALRDLMSANAGAPLDPATPPLLNGAAAKAGLTLHFDDAGAARVRASAPGVPGAIGDILTIVEDAMAEGTWARLKVCRADDCRWAFYDRSKNRSGAWCVMSVCGNREKARSYRDRRTGSRT